MRAQATAMWRLSDSGKSLPWLCAGVRLGVRVYVVSVWIAPSELDTAPARAETNLRGIKQTVQRGNLCRRPAAWTLARSRVAYQAALSAPPAKSPLHFQAKQKLR